MCAIKIFFVAQDVKKWFSQNYLYMILRSSFHFVLLTKPIIPLPKESMQVSDKNILFAWFLKIEVGANFS